ncbi:MAG: segregation/condensation protein A, partial [Pseudomonadota bacterium]
VTFLAILELVKESLIDIVQQDTFGTIHVKTRDTISPHRLAREGDDDTSG